MMIRAASLPIEVNLLRFSRFLQSQGIAHRINEESGQQVIWVEGDQQATLIREALTNWPFDEDSSLGSPVADNLMSLFSPVALLRKLIQAFLRAPVSFSLIGVLIGCLAQFTWCSAAACGDPVLSCARFFRATSSACEHR